MCAVITLILLLGTLNMSCRFTVPVSSANEYGVRHLLK